MSIQITNMTKPFTLLPVCQPTTDISVLVQVAAELNIALLPSKEPQLAMADCQQAMPEIVVLDEANLALASQIKGCAVLLLTANYDPAFLAQQLQNGIDEFLFAPLNPIITTHRLTQQVTLAERSVLSNRLTRQTLKLREMGELVGLVSHEVASPLGNISTAVSFLLEAAEKIKASFDDKKLAAHDLERYLQQSMKALTMCVKNGSNAGEIISSFRTVATGQCLEEIQQFYLHRFIDEIVLTLKSKLKKLPHEIHVVISEGVEMTSDSGAFSQLINGLINKSIVHGFDSKVSGQIIINAAVEEHQGHKMVIVNYVDNGCGMSAETIENLLHNERPSDTNTLTTSMLNRLVEEQLRGTMTVESHEGKGVHFTINMPQNIATE